MASSNDHDFAFISTLQEKAVNHISALQTSYRSNTSRWNTATLNFIDAHTRAYNLFDGALKATAKLKTSVLEISFFVLTLIPGKGLDWIQSLLLQRADLFNADTRKLFGDIAGAINGSLNALLKDQTQKKIAFQMPSPFNTYDPNGLGAHLTAQFATQCQPIINYLEAIKQKIKEHEGFAFIERLVENKSKGEATNLVRWIFDVGLERDICKSSYYYNYAPDMPNTDDMAKRIERCMWAELFKANDPMPPKLLRRGYKGCYSPVPDIGSGPLSQGIEVLKFLLYKPGSPVEKRLIALDIMAPKGKKRKDKAPHYSLPNFGIYTDDRELQLLSSWAHNYETEYVGGAMDPGREISSNIIWNDFRSRTIRHLK